MDEQTINTPTQSPLPQAKPTVTTQATMDFFEAMKKVAEGKKIHRLDWENKEFYGFLNGGILSLHKPDGKNYQWVVNDGDIAGTDYIIL